ncbi:MAG: glycosyltransferase family 2 protein [Bryobacteraceae bacterium]
MLFSVVVPVYNEAAVLPAFWNRLSGVLKQVGCAWEVLFVNDGSRDGTPELLAELSRQEPRVKVLSFSRNFGHQAAITAGLDFAAGDAVAMMDADLQDPPELLPQMLQLYEQGYEVVSAQRASRRGDPWLKRKTATLFYWVMRRAMSERLLPEVGDYRLFSREALEAIRGFREQHRFMRGLVAWLGLKEAVVSFHREPRFEGESKYPLLKMLRLSWTGISSFSALPLRIATLCGFMLCFIAFGFFLYVLYGVFVIRNVVPGWASLAALQCLFSGITLVSVGLTADYVARIYDESKNRPLYIVSGMTNMRRPDVTPPRAVICCRDPAGSPADGAPR